MIKFMHPTDLSSDSCRAARELLRISQPELADLAGISVSTVRRFESGVGRPSAYAARQLLIALQREGIEFIGSRRDPTLG